MRRRAHSVALLAGLAMVLTAVPVVAQDDATVSYRNWYHGGSMETVWDDYIASYEADNPVNVEVQTIPFPRYNDVLTVELAAGEPPDVAWINASVGPQWVKSGRLVDLMPLVPEGYDLDDFGAALDPWREGDSLYALPFTNAGNLVYFNTDAFEAAGVPTPIEMYEAGDWTWENVVSTAAAIKAAEGIDYGFLFNNNLFTNGWRNLIEIWSPYGAGPWTVDGTECTFDSPETKAATQIVWDMIYTDETHPGPGETADFAAGNIGMMLGRQNVAPRLAEVPFGWDVVPPPSGPAGFVPSLAQNGVVAFADSDNPDLAGGFVLHAMNKENAAKFGVNTPAVRKSLQTMDIIAENNPQYTQEQLERAVLPVLASEDFRMEYFHENYTPAEKAAQLIFDGQIWNPDADVSAALDQVCSDIGVFMSRD
jgi:multiple sugar transport system substrate-binding protein